MGYSLTITKCIGFLVNDYELTKKIDNMENFVESSNIIIEVFEASFCIIIDNNKQITLFESDNVGSNFSNSITNGGSEVFFIEEFEKPNIDFYLSLFEGCEDCIDELKEILSDPKIKYGSMIAKIWT
jgi:hypothetical protein